MPLLSDLLRVRSIDEILNSVVLPAMQSRGLSVTAWGPLDPWRILALALATMRQGLDAGQAAWAAAGFGDYVFGRAPVPGGIDVTPWAGLRAKQWYGVTPIAATYTVRTIHLANSSGSNYGPLPQGSLILLFPSGNRYIQQGNAVTIPANGSVDVAFRSEFPSNTAAGTTYNSDPSSASPIVFVTANYPGVTATNPAGTFSSTAQTGPGLGAVTPSGAPGSPHSIAARIDTTGNAAAGTWSVSLDGGAFVAEGAIGVLANFGGAGITITPANNGGSPAFIAGTIYYFQNPGSDITQVGRDAETPQQLGARSMALLPSLAFPQDAAGNWIPTSPTISAYEALARSASSQAAIVLVQTDGTINNKVNIVISGQGALLPSSVVALVQQFMNVWTMLTDSPSVVSATARPVNLASMAIKVTASLLVSAQAALATSIAKYLAGVDPAALLAPNGLIDRSYIQALARRTPGVTHIDDGLTIGHNGGTYVAADLQLPVTGGAFEIATWAEAGSIGSIFTWTPV